MLRRRVSPTKRSSMPKVCSKPSSLGQRNVFFASRGDAAMPKTRFTLNDRSSSSPRLKSFPAEEIKRPEALSPGNSWQSGTVMRPTMDNRQGDTPQLQWQQQIPIQSHSSFQAATIPNPNVSSISEEQATRLPYSPIYRVNQTELVIPTTMPNSSPRRFGPNVPQTNLPMKDELSRKETSTRSFGAFQTIDQSQLSRTVEPEAQIYHRDSCNIENDSPKPADSEKESAQETAFHCRDLETHGMQSVENRMRDRIQPTRISTSRNRDSSNLCPVSDPTSCPDSRQICRAYPPSLPHRDTEMPEWRMIEVHPGMTSPQDIAVNRIRNYQKIMNPYEAKHSCWIRNRVPRIERYSQDIATPESHVRGRYSQYGYPARSSDTTERTADENSANKMENTKLRFTEAMMRDQEMLVTSMRQQGIAEDTMRRQFDALLAEQRKQLLYLEQLKHGGSNAPDEMSQQPRRVRRKISRIEEDGKPEWMLHITPPRIPYGTLETMRYERDGGNDALSRTGQINDQTNRSNDQRVCVQTNAFENWEGDAPRASYGNCNSYVPEQYRKCNSAICDDPGKTTLIHAHPIQYAQQPPQPYMQQIQEKFQTHGENNNDGKEFQQTQRYAEPERKIEPSSLLKLRLYKEVVRRQKQNNGLQDPETVKEAVEALKNPANRRGLEYLENLYKRHAKALSLNGTQDPRESIALPNGPRQQYISLNCQRVKAPSANGLEKPANPNDSQPRSSLLRKKIDNPNFAEYPRRRTSSVSRDCRSSMAERENATVANSLAKEYREENGAGKDRPIGASNQRAKPLPENGYRCPSDMQRNDVYRDQELRMARSFSTPFAFTERNRPEFYAAPIEQCHEYRQKSVKVNSFDPQRTMLDSTGFADKVVVDEGNNAQRQCYYRYPYKNLELHEPITIGGIKYLARKPEYIQNSSTPTVNRDQLNLVEYSYPMVSCQ